MRLPKAPKMLPRRPMAAGTSTSSPGYFANVSVIDPRNAPAMKLVDEFNDCATRLWRTPDASGPSSARRRATKEKRGRRMEPPQSATLGVWQ
jgi:hypothetical protein